MRLGSNQRAGAAGSFQTGQHTAGPQRWRLCALHQQPGRQRPMAGSSPGATGDEGRTAAGRHTVLPAGLVVRGPALSPLPAAPGLHLTCASAASDTRGRRAVWPTMQEPTP